MSHTELKMQEKPRERLQDRWWSTTDRWWRWECRCWDRCWCNWSWPLGRRQRWGRPGCGCRRCPVGCSAGTSACSRWCCGQTLSLSTQSLTGRRERREPGLINTVAQNRKSPLTSSLSFIFMDSVTKILSQFITTCHFNLNVLIITIIACLRYLVFKTQLNHNITMNRTSLLIIKWRKEKMKRDNDLVLSLHANNTTQITELIRK